MAWGALTQLTQLEITNHYDDNLLPCFWTVLPRLPHLRSLNLSNFDINNSLLVAVRMGLRGREEGRGEEKWGKGTEGNKDRQSQAVIRCRERGAGEWVTGSGEP
ncbi:hypothetical protein Vretifemale_546 [Volvox reticuliferus]|nr:hypothetical protein Vretifemale_546 [Volvox reticuliferus]